MPKPKLPDLVIALGKGPKEPDLDDEEMDEAAEEQEEGKGDDQGKVAAAQDIIDAVKSGDATLLAEALDNHHAIVDAQAESEEDQEEQAEEMGMADGGKVHHKPDPDTVRDMNMADDYNDPTEFKRFLRTLPEGHPDKSDGEEMDRQFQEYLWKKHHKYADGGEVDESLSPMAQANIQTRSDMLTKGLDELSAKPPVDIDPDELKSTRKMAKGGVADFHRGVAATAKHREEQYFRAHNDGPDDMTDEDLRHAALHAKEIGDEDSEYKFTDYANEKESVRQQMESEASDDEVHRMNRFMASHGRFRRYAKGGAVDASGNPLEIDPEDLPTKEDRELGDEPVGGPNESLKSPYTKEVMAADHGAVIRDWLRDDVSSDRYDSLSHLANEAPTLVNDAIGEKMEELGLTVDDLTDEELENAIYEQIDNASPRQLAAYFREMHGVREKGEEMYGPKREKGKKPVLLAKGGRVPSTEEVDEEVQQMYKEHGDKVTARAKDDAERRRNGLNISEKEVDDEIESMHREHGEKVAARARKDAETIRNVAKLDGTEGMVRPDSVKSPHQMGYRAGLHIYDEPGAEDDINDVEDMDWYLKAMSEDSAKNHGGGHPDFAEGYRRGAARAIEKRRGRKK